MSRQSMSGSKSDLSKDEKPPEDAAEGLSEGTSSRGCPYQESEAQTFQECNTQIKIGHV